MRIIQKTWIVSLLLCLIHGNVVGTWEQGKDLNLRESVHSNAWLKFAVSTPPGWEFEKSENESTFNVRWIDPQNRNGVLIKVMDLGPEVTVEELAGRYPEVMVDSMPSYKALVSSKPFAAIDLGQPGARMFFKEYQDVSRKQSMRNYTGYAVSGEYGIAVTTLYFPGDSRAQRIARLVARSFRLLSPPSPQLDPDYKLYADDKFGFSLELPKTWEWQVDENKNYIVSGPAGSDAAELMVVLQFVIKSPDSGSTLQSQMEGLKEQLAEAQDSQVKTQGSNEIGGAPAEYIGISYTAADSSNGDQRFGFFQVIIDHGGYFYWISFSARMEVYEKYQSEYIHMLETLRFLR